MTYEALKPNELLAAAKLAFKSIPVVDKSTLTIKSTDNLQLKLSALINHFEEMKYPAPPFKCKNLQVQVGERSVPVIYVEKDENAQGGFNKKQHSNIALYAYLVRALSLARALEKYSEKELSPAQYEKVSNTLRKVIQQEIKTIEDMINAPTVSKIDTYKRST